MAKQPETNADDFKTKFEKLQQQNIFLVAQIKELEKIASTEQEMKELALKMLWVMYRMPKCGTTKEIGKVLPKFKEWVGEKRADELEALWRKGSA